MTHGILGLLHVTKGKLDHLSISFDIVDNGRGPLAYWRNWCSALKGKFAVPVQLPGDSKARDRWRVVGIGRPGGVPMGATLDSMSKSITKSMV